MASNCVIHGHPYHGRAVYFRDYYFAFFHFTLSGCLQEILILKLKPYKLDDTLSRTSLGISGRKCKVVGVGSKLLFTLLMVSVPMRI